MIIFIKIVLFLLGMVISVQIIAAFYRIIDLWYTIHTAYLKVIQGILGWIGVSVIIAVLLGYYWRRAFLWGMVLYVPFYLINFVLIQSIIRYRCQPKEND
jgi:predicted tellurium resistance membrane protein TerC